VIADMALPSLHYLTAKQAAAYEKTPLDLKPTVPQNGCITAKGSAAFFCNYVYETFITTRPTGPPSRRARPCGTRAA
jgi:hypothetical protein